MANQQKAMTEGLLKARGLGISFGAIQAVDGVDLDLAPGEVLGIIGPNGAGKTTLFNLLAGGLKPSRGRVFLDGHDISSSGPEARARLGLVRTFQHGRVFGALSARDNLLLGSHLRRRHTGLPGELASTLGGIFLKCFGRKASAEEAALVDDARELAALFGERLLPRLDDGAWQFSYANRRRIELARALAARPRVLLLDEPTAGMNPRETLEMLEVLRSLKAKGQAMVVIEHKLPLVMELADRVMVMDEGRVIASDLPGRVALDPRVIEAYLGHGHRFSSGAFALEKGSHTPLVRLEPEHPLLELRQVSAGYGEMTVLHGLDMKVGPGEMVCLLGGNASGKSTTMKTILGLVKPQSGAVFWQGEDMAGLSVPQRIRAGLASVPESRRIFADMSVRENILMGGYLIKDRRELLCRFEEVAELFPLLGERCSQRSGTLSGGEQQMLALARALMGRPRLVCMDEPTMGLSPLWVDRVLGMIQDVNRRGTAVLMVEQNAHLALDMAHRAYVLQNGSLVLSGPAARIARDPRIRDAYLGGEMMEGI